MLLRGVASLLELGGGLGVTALRTGSRNFFTSVKSAELVVLGFLPSALSASGTTSSAPSSRLVRPWLLYLFSAW